MKEAIAISCICVMAACGGETKSGAPATAALAPTAEASAAPPAVASAAPPAEPPPPPKSLYDRLSGDSGITKLVDAALAAIKADKRVARYLPKDAKKLAALHDDLVSQIGAAAGGPASTRSDPRTTVTAMKIKPKDFDFIVEDVGKVASGALSAPEAKEVMDALTAMRDGLVAGGKK